MAKSKLDPVQIGGGLLLGGLLGYMLGKKQTTTPAAGPFMSVPVLPYAPLVTSSPSQRLAADTTGLDLSDQAIATFFRIAWMNCAEWMQLPVDTTNAFPFYSAALHHTGGYDVLAGSSESFTAIRSKRGYASSFVQSQQPTPPRGYTRGIYPEQIDQVVAAIDSYCYRMTHTAPTRYSALPYLKRS